MIRLEGFKGNGNPSLMGLTGEAGPREKATSLLPLGKRKEKKNEKNGESSSGPGVPCL